MTDLPDPKQQLVERIGEITPMSGNRPLRLYVSQEFIEALASAWLEDVEKARLDEASWWRAEIKQMLEEMESPQSVLQYKGHVRITNITKMPPQGDGDVLDHGAGMEAWEHP